LHVSFTAMTAPRVADVTLADDPRTLGENTPGGAVPERRRTHGGRCTNGRRATDFGVTVHPYLSRHDRTTTVCSLCRNSGFVQVDTRTVICELCDSYELWLSDEWCERYSGVRVHTS
jgi:hypothetical protein